MSRVVVFWLKINWLQITQLKTRFCRNQTDFSEINIIIFAIARIILRYEHFNLFSVHFSSDVKYLLISIFCSALTIRERYKLLQLPPTIVSSARERTSGNYAFVSRFP